MKKLLITLVTLSSLSSFANCIYTYGNNGAYDNIKYPMSKKLHKFLKKNNCLEKSDSSELLDDTLELNIFTDINPHTYGSQFVDVLKKIDAITTIKINNVTKLYGKSHHRLLLNFSVSGLLENKIDMTRYESAEKIAARRAEKKALEILINSKVF